MRYIVLKSETDWDGWRRAARALILAGAEPRTLTRSVGGETESVPEASGTFHVQGRWCRWPSRDPGAGAGAVRSALQPGLAIQCGGKAAGGRDDPDLALVRRMALAVRADAHRMRTPVRFLPVGRRPPVLSAGSSRPFRAAGQRLLIARRYPDPAWSIVTPTGRRTGTAHAAVGPDSAMRRTMRPCRRGGRCIANSCWTRLCRRFRCRRPRRWTRSLARLTGPRWVRWFFGTDADPAFSRSAKEALGAIVSRYMSRHPDRVRRRAGGRGGDVRGGTTGGSGGHDRPALCRARRPNDGPCDGGGRDRPSHSVCHQRGETLQVYAARAAADPQTPEVPEIHACGFWLDVERGHVRPRCWC